MKRKLLVVDTETGGFDARQHSILSFAAVIYQDGGIAGEFYTLVREPELCVDDEAMKVNGLTVSEIDAAPPPWLVLQRFANWLYANQLYGPQTLAGHKIDFDVAFLQRLWRLVGADFEKQFGHRYLCTQTAALLLEQAGRINLPGGSASLDNVAGVFGCHRTSDTHNALEDARLCARVLGKMVERLK